MNIPAGNAAEWICGVKKVPNLFKQLKYMNIKKELQEILKQISDNMIDAWEDDMEETRQVVVLENFKKQIPDGDEIPDTIYNGWHDRLIQLSKIV